MTEPVTKKPYRKKRYYPRVPTVYYRARRLCRLIGLLERKGFTPDVYIDRDTVVVRTVELPTFLVRFKLPVAALITDTAPDTQKPPKS